MRWPWSKQPIEETEQITIPKAPPEREVVWKAVVGEWRRFSVCHCGHSRESLLEEICPKCGCRDEWIDIVGREEWEEEDWGDLPSIRWAFGGPPKRNHRIVGWTPEHCGVKPFSAKPPLCHSCGEAEMERQVSQTGPWKFGGEK